MIYLAAAISLVLFVWALRWSRAVETAGAAVTQARSAVAMLRDGTLSDDEKEKRARASSLRLLVQAAAIAARLAGALAIPLAFLALLAALNMLSVGPLVAFLESWKFAVISCVAVVAALAWR